ncbi:MAG: pro-sigmaK processing inhibitor BofA family protein [Firmicutes bacterium]|jgi:hypothetical protein|nr:pro-sigmaK processing inhibitor BofA family protein [Bacillota bacterium]
MALYGWLALMLAAGILFVMARAYFGPLAFVLRAGIRVVAGGAVLYAWDLFVASGTHLALGVNPVSSAVTGWLGGPGLALLVGVRWLGTHPGLPPLFIHLPHVHP